MANLKKSLGRYKLHFNYEYPNSRGALGYQDIICNKISGHLLYYAAVVTVDEQMDENYRIDPEQFIIAIYEKYRKHYLQEILKLKNQKKKSWFFDAFSNKDMHIRSYQKCLIALRQIMEKYENLKSISPKVNNEADS